MILNKNLTSEILSEQLDELLKNPDELKKMSAASLKLGRSQAAEEISDLILKLSEK